MEEWLNLLSRAPGTGSAGTGWPQEVIDFITCLFEVGFCCLVSSLLSPQWEVLSVTLWSCRILSRFVVEGWQTLSFSDEMERLERANSPILQSWVLTYLSWSNQDYCHHVVTAEVSGISSAIDNYTKVVSFLPSMASRVIVVILWFHLNVCVSHYGKMCCWRWFWSALLCLSVCI